MARLLFVVEYTFKLERRGLALGPGPSMADVDWLPRCLPLLLRRPDGSELRVIASLSFGHGVSDGRLIGFCQVLLPPGIDKHDVPVGTEVLLPFEERTFTLAQYDQIVMDGYCESGCDRHFELIRGTIRAYLSRPPLYEDLVDRLNKWSHRGRGHEGIRVRVRSPIEMTSLASAPLPDVMWIADGDYAKRYPRPEEVLLVIDVDPGRDSYELKERIQLFAEAEIPEYWLLRAKMRRLVVHRDPRGAVYRSITSLRPDQEATPLADPGSFLGFGSLLPG